MNEVNFIKHRHNQISAILRKNKIDFILSNQQAFINYITDAIDIPGYVIIDAKAIRFYTDARFKIEAAKLDTLIKVKIPSVRFYQYISKETKLVSKKIGIDSFSLSFGEMEEVKAALLPTEIKNIGIELAGCMNNHDNESLKRTKKAVEISKRVFFETKNSLALGITEIEVACLISSRSRLLGAEGESFPAIVAFGENSAKPHSKPSNRKLKDGDVVLIDMGCIYKGLNSDFTRTFIFGDKLSQAANTIDIIKSISIMTGKKLSLEISPSASDEMARIELRKYSLEKYFTHSLGHGIGYIVHIAPRISIHSKDVYKENMIVTIEPGVYFEGQYGVRHEDMYIITRGKPINLTKF